MTDPRRPGLLTRLRGDRRGVTAVEFAMLAPVIIALYFGLAEFCQGFMAQKRAGHATSLIADLVAQRDTVTGAEVDDIFQIGGLIMKPYSATPLKMRVSSVTRGTDDVVRVDWSRGSGLTARTVNSTVAIPTGLIERGESVVMSETTYDYDSPVDYLTPAITRFSQTFYLRPRSVDKTGYTN
ncbi:pilus assembly protein [Rhizobium sp. CRIBSB]|nr:pilus assembly protein [Rhizobium sp. CRIBSB]